MDVADSEGYECHAVQGSESDRDDEAEKVALVAVANAGVEPGACLCLSE